MNKNTSELKLAKHMRRVTEGELWELVDTGRDNVKKNGLTDDIINLDKTQYPSHALAEVMDGKTVMIES